MTCKVGQVNSRTAARAVVLQTPSAKLPGAHRQFSGLVRLLNSHRRGEQGPFSKNMPNFSHGFSHSR